MKNFKSLTKIALLLVLTIILTTFSTVFADVPGSGLNFYDSISRKDLNRNQIKAGLSNNTLKYENIWHKDGDKYVNIKDFEKAEERGISAYMEEKPILLKNLIAALKDKNSQITNELKIKIDIEQSKVARKTKAEIHGTPQDPQEPRELIKARAAVVKAEASRLKADVDAARILVNALPPSNVKTNLQARLDAIVIAPASNDTALKSLTINGQVVAGFTSDLLSYSVKLPAGTSAFPAIEAIARDNKAKTVISLVETFPWSANILVTAENGITIQTYTINFSIDQSAPSGLVGVSPSMPGRNDGKITGTTTAMEYRMLPELTWIPVTGTEITGLSSGFYDVRYAAKIGFNEGIATTIGVEPGPNQAQEAPTGLLGVAPSTLGGNDGKITGTTNAMEYLVEGTWIPVTGTEIIGLAVGFYDVRYAAKKGFNESPAATIGVPAPANQDQTAPTGLIGVAPTTFGGNDGKITGVNNTMEYLVGEIWIPVAGTEIAGLVSGWYDVRYSAKAGFNESLAATILVPVTENLGQGAPTENLIGIAPTTFGGNDGKITGSTTAMEYRPLADTNWTTVTAAEILGLASGFYDVRYTSKPGFDPGPAVTIGVAEGPKQAQAAPTGLLGVATSTFNANDGKITGTTSAMEYRALADSTWTAVTGTEITGLAAGFYDVRYAAKLGFEEGPAATVGVPTPGNQSQGSPTEVLTGVAPTAFGGSDGKIIGTTSAMEYLLGGVWTPVLGSEITGLSVGWYDVRYAAKPGYNEGIAATIGVPAPGNQAQAAPTGLSMVAPTTFKGVDGKIIGATSAMEYRALADTTWTAVTGTEITGLKAGYYFVRYAAKLGYDASLDTSVQIKEGEATLNAVTIDGVSLAGFSSDKLTYDIQLPAGTVSVPVVMASALDGNAPVVISPATSLPGETTILVTAQDGVTSKMYTINFILINPSPLGLKAVAPTTLGGSDGKITGTTSAMEYKTTAGSSWIPVTGTEITGLSAGSYDVRYAAQPGYSVGTAANVIVPNKGSGKLIFTFDDGWKDTITLGKTILDTAGYKATVYVNKDLTQIAEYEWTPYHVENVMNYDDLRVLYNHGWDISNHSANHLDFKRNAEGLLLGKDGEPLQWQTPEAYGQGHPELNEELWFSEWYKTLVQIGSDSDPKSVEEMRKVYLDNQNWLSNSDPDGLGKLVNGVWTPGRNLNMPLGAYHVAYPSGLYSPELITALKGIGVETGRATIETGIKNNIENPVTDFFNLPVQYVETQTEGGVDENLANVFGSIQYAVDNGTTVILMLHRVGPVVDPANNLFVTPESLQAIVNYAKERTDAGTLDVMTISQWYNMMK